MLKQKTLGPQFSESTQQVRLTLSPSPLLYWRTRLPILTGLFQHKNCTKGKTSHNTAKPAIWCYLRKLVDIFKSNRNFLLVCAKYRDEINKAKTRSLKTCHIF